MDHRITINKVKTSTQNELFADILGHTLYDGQVEAKRRTTWFYENSPSERYLVYKDDVAIGTIGFNLRSFNTPLGRKTGALAADFAILKEHRNIKAAIYLVTDSVNDILNQVPIDFVYTIPNKNSSSVIKRTRLFASAGLFQRHIKLISFEEVLEGSRVQFLKPVVDTIWSAATRVAKLPYKKGVHDVNFNFNSTGGITAKNRLAPYAVGERSEEYLTWRYGETPDDNYYTYSVSDEGRNAYLIFSMIKNRAYVFDMIYPHDDMGIAINLLTHFEGYCRDLNKSMIVLQYLGAHNLIEEVERKLWYRRYNPTNKELLIASKDVKLTEHLCNNSFWFAGDEDAIA